MELDPLAVALKFGFIAVLYLFLLWVSRSALRDLRRTETGESIGPGPSSHDATAMHRAGAAITAHGGMPRLRVESAPGMRAGAAYDVSGGDFWFKSAEDAEAAGLTRADEKESDK